MSRLPDLLIAACLLLLLFSASALSQDRQRRSSLPNTVARTAGKAAVVVVGTAAKGVWETSKFAARYGAKPVTKLLLKSAVPVAAKITRSAAKEGLKRGLPVAVKLALL